MADVNATYGIELAVTGQDSAEDAAKALENLRDKIAEDTASLREMQATLRRLQGSTTTSAETFKKLRDAIAAKKTALAQSSQALVTMKGAFESLGPSARRGKQATDGLGFDKLKREVFGAEKSFLGLHLSTLRAVPPQIALAAALGAVVIGLTAATIAIGKFGIAAADARRSEAIMLQAAGTHLWYAYGVEASKAGDLTEDGAKAIQGAVDRVASSTAIGREKISGYAEELLKARLSGQDLEKALKAVSTAASVGKEAGLVGAFASLKFMGMSVDALADKIDQKFGGLARRRMLALDVQVMKLKEDWAKLWKGVNIEPLLEALHKVFSLFSTTTASGYALKAIIEAMFPEASAKAFGDIAAQAFKRVVIGALYATIGLLTLRNKFLDLRDWIDKTFKVDSVKAFGKALLTAVVGPAALLLDLFKGAGEAAGRGVVDGIKTGIDSGKPDVAASGAGLGKAAVGGFRDELKIRSPSRLFFEDARDRIAGATSAGLRAGAPDVEAAARDMAPEPASRAAARGDRGTRPIMVTIHAPIEIAGAQIKDQAGLLDKLEEKLSDVFERAAQKLAVPLEKT